MGEIEISVLVPVYNEEENVIPLYKRIVEELEPITRNFEIVFVDDGSTDRTLKKVRSLIKKDKRVSIHTFYRNFGKANALETGFKHVKGDIVFTMDGDLQDDPSEFSHFLDELDKDGIVEEVNTHIEPDLELARVLLEKEPATVRCTNVSGYSGCVVSGVAGTRANVARACGLLGKAAYAVG